MAAELDALRRELVGETLVTLDGERSSCRLKECNLGNYDVFEINDQVMRGSRKFCQRRVKL